jgi:hypothetical protein
VQLRGGGFRRLAAVAMVAVTLAGCAAPPARPATPIAWSSNHASEQAEARVGRLMAQAPLTFEANRGQEDARVAFLARNGALTAFYTETGVTYRLTGRDPLDAPLETPGLHTGRPQLDDTTDLTAWVIGQELVGGRAVSPSGDEQTDSIVSYFRGQPEEWITGVPTFRGLTYPAVWPGIDVVYRGDGSHLDAAYVVQPGGNPDQVRLIYHGGTTTLTERGELAGVRHLPRWGRIGGRWPHRRRWQRRDVHFRIDGLQPDDLPERQRSHDPGEAWLRPDQQRVVVEYNVIRRQVDRHRERQRRSGLCHLPGWIRR